MPDTGSHRHTAPRAPHQRPPPLLVIAATGLAVVIGLGITLVILRLRAGDPGTDGKIASPAPALTLTQPEPPRAPVDDHAAPAPEHREPVHPSGSPPPPSESPPTEVPAWERKPLRTSQPFPEEARFDPPMPPIKIPAEMLIPLGASDAAVP